MKRNWIFYFGTLIALAGAGYLDFTTKVADLGASQKRDSAIIAPFDYEHTYYQTIIPTLSDLFMIEFPLGSLGYSEEYDFYLSIQLTDEGGNEIISKQFQISKSMQIQTIRLSFKPRPDSLHKKYRLFLQTDAPPRLVYLLGSEYDSYIPGELVSNDGSMEHFDLAFFTYAKPTIFALSQKLIVESGKRLANILFITIIFWGLGHILTIFFLPYQDPIEWGIGTLLTGIAIPPALFFILSLFRIRIGNYLLPAVFLALILSAALGILIFPKKNWKKNPVPFRLEELIALCLLLIIAVITRLIQIDDLIVPSGIGSQFHLNAIEHLIQTGDLPLDSIYHLGFHSNAAMISEVTNNTIPETMLLYGQWLSIASGLSFYLLARIFFGNWIYALIATSFYWFVSSMPAYLINIARYPFLQGLTLLPWAGILIWNNRKNNAPNEIVTLIVLTGLFLSHYGSIAILAVVVMGLIIIHRTNANRALINSGRTTGFAVVCALVLLIALIKFYYALTQGSWESFLSAQTIDFTSEDYIYVFNHTLRHGGLLLWFFGTLGGILYFARHTRLVLMPFFCIAVLLCIDWLQMRLFGHSATRPANTVFALAIPLSLFAGLLMEYMFNGREFPGIVVMIVLVAAAAYNIGGIVNPSNVFYSAADQSAMDWIKINTPEESVFLINSYPWEENIGPTDGGSWIPSMTGRETVFANTQQDYDHIETFVRQTDADFVYIGSGYGNITPLVMNALNKILVYESNGIYIYSLDDTPTLENMNHDRQLTQLRDWYILSRK